MKAKKVQKIKRAKNPWLEHLMAERNKYPKKKFKEIMILAKKSYKPIHK